MNWLTQACRAVAEIFSFTNKRTDLKNAADVKERAKAQSESNASARAAEAYKKGDVDEIRRQMAE